MSNRTPLKGLDVCLAWWESLTSTTITAEDKTINWPELPQNSVILHECDDANCPQRFWITKIDESYQITIAMKFGCEDNQQLMTKDQVYDAAVKMLEFIGYRMLHRRERKD